MVDSYILFKLFLNLSLNIPINCILIGRKTVEWELLEIIAKHWWLTLCQESKSTIKAVDRVSHRILIENRRMQSRLFPGTKFKWVLGWVTPPPPSLENLSFPRAKAVDFCRAIYWSQDHWWTTVTEKSRNFIEVTSLTASFLQRSSNKGV